MAEFSAAANLDVRINESTLSQARQTIESELGDVSVSVEASPSDAVGGGGSGGGGGIARGQRAGVLDASREQLDVQQTLSDLAETRNEILQDILDALQGGGGGGGGGRIPRRSLGLLGGGLAGGLLLGSVVGSTVSNALSSVKINPSDIVSGAVNVTADMVISSAAAVVATDVIATRATIAASDLIASKAPVVASDIVGVTATVVASDLVAKGATITAGALVAKAATVTPSALIAKGATVTAGALIAEGASIDAGSLVGTAATITASALIASKVSLSVSDLIDIVNDGGTPTGGTTPGGTTTDEPAPGDTMTGTPDGTGGGTAAPTPVPWQRISDVTGIPVAQLKGMSASRLQDAINAAGAAGATGAIPISNSPIGQPVNGVGGGLPLGILGSVAATGVGIAAVPKVARNLLGPGIRRVFGGGGGLGIGIPAPSIIGARFLPSIQDLRTPDQGDRTRRRNRTQTNVNVDSTVRVEGATDRDIESVVERLINDLETRLRRELRDDDTTYRPGAQ